MAMIITPLPFGLQALVLVTAPITDLSGLPVLLSLFPAALSLVPCIKFPLLSPMVYVFPD